MVKRQIGSSDGMPTFPKKKYFGNMEPAFLQQRCQQLTLFLQVFLAHPLVKTCPLVPVYFKGKAFGDESMPAIQNLIAYMNGQPLIKPPMQRFTGQIDHRGAATQDSPSNAAAQSPSKLIKMESENRGAVNDNENDFFATQQSPLNQQNCKFCALSKFLVNLYFCVSVIIQLRIQRISKNSTRLHAGRSLMR